MQNNKGLQPNYAETAAEVLDSEVIIIRLTDGMYYSMQGVGVCVWRLIEAKHDVDDIVRAVMERYGVELDRVKGDIDNLIESLLSERLIISDESSTKKVRAKIPTDRDLGALSYETPTLNVYEDMNDLLALDPPSPGRQGFNSPLN